MTVLLFPKFFLVKKVIPTIADYVTFTRDLETEGPYTEPKPLTILVHFRLKYEASCAIKI